MPRMNIAATPRSLQDRLASNVRRLMSENELSRDEVADSLGVTGPRVSQLLSGSRRLQLYWVERFAEALGVDDPLDLLQESI